jgi:hypothetical protein
MIQSAMTWLQTIQLETIELQMIQLQTIQLATTFYTADAKAKE